MQGVSSGHDELASGATLTFFRTSAARASAPSQRPVTRRSSGHCLEKKAETGGSFPASTGVPGAMEERRLARVCITFSRESATRRCSALVSSLRPAKPMRRTSRGRGGKVGELSLFVMLCSAFTDRCFSKV